MAQKLAALIVSVLLVAGIGALPATSAFAEDQEHPVHVSDLLQHADSYLNHVVEVEIVEPLFGPSTPDALAKTEYGQIVIGTPSYSNLALVPSSFELSDPNRYRHKFDRVIDSPIRVRGELLEDKEISAAEHRAAYVFRVVSLEPIALGAAEVLHSILEIDAEPARWNRKRVVYEGTYESRFEVSALDRVIWLGLAPHAEISKRPASGDGRSSHRVRVTGILFTGSFYGHLGSYRYELVASKLEYLD